MDPGWLGYSETPVRGQVEGPSCRVWGLVTFVSHTGRHNSILTVASRSAVSVLGSPARFSFTGGRGQGLQGHSPSAERSDSHTQSMGGFVSISNATNHCESISQLPGAIPFHVLNSSPEFLLYFASLCTHCLILIRVYHVMER